jgi:branched-chain amino acid transport system permease protein
VLERYAAVLPGLAPAGAEGISSAVLAKFAFGAAIVALLVFEPGGAAAVAGRLRRRVMRLRSGRR